MSCRESYCLPWIQRINKISSRYLWTTFQFKKQKRFRRYNYDGQVGRWSNLLNSLHWIATFDKRKKSSVLIFSSFNFSATQPASNKNVTSLQLTKYDTTSLAFLTNHKGWTMLLFFSFLGERMSILFSFKLTQITNQLFLQILFRIYSEIITPNGRFASVNCNLNVSQPV